MTLAELRAYLAVMTEAAHKYDVEENATTIASRMWQHFTQEAIAHMGAAFCLRRIADQLDPETTPDEAADDEDDEA
ncbi:MAG TPA: hypothetical protein VGI78_10870 [Acetobacteraceae bacterium]|jgi:hypothetical protein